MTRSICVFLIGTLIVLAIPGRECRADESQRSLADRAVVSKYRIARLLRDKYLATATIKSSDKTIKAAPARIKKEQAVADKAKAAKTITDKAVAEKQAAVTSAEEKAKNSDDASVKATVAQAIRELNIAKQAASRKDYEFKRAEAKLTSETDRLNKAKSDKIAAEKAIPENQAAADKETARYEELREQSIAAELKLRATQSPSTVSVRIDEVIERRLAKEKIPASAQVEDGKFLRRATLDIAGRIPTYQEVIGFLKDDSPNKRAAAVDRLLASEDYGRTFGTIFADLTTHRPTTTATRTNNHFREWLVECLNLNRRWDDITTDMLAGEGDTGSNPGSIYLVAYRLNNQPDPPAIFSSAGEMFMGLQIKCAQCHDHPFVEGWSQDDFWSMTAMFSRVRLRGNSVYRALEYELTDDDVDEKQLFRAGGGVKYPPPLPSGQIAIPDPTDETKTLKTISAKYLDGNTPALPEKGFYRKEFAKWLTSKDNPYFARAMVNRLWGHFFARGLVQPIAHMNPDNKPSHPEILDSLEGEFKKSGYDLKHLIRCIVNSRTYQRSSRPSDQNINDKEFYSHMAVKTLEADALFDSLTVAIGRRPMSDNRRQTYKDLFDTRLPEVDPGKFTHSIPQVLRMMNAREYNDASSIVSVATNGKEPAEAISGLFLAALARRPNETESKNMLKYVSEEAAKDKRQAYADVYWVLINSAEFLVNH
jgi:hypothetical protein